MYTTGDYIVDVFLLLLIEWYSQIVYCKAVDVNTHRRGWGEGSVRGYICNTFSDNSQGSKNVLV